MSLRLAVSVISIALLALALPESSFVAGAPMSHLETWYLPLVQHPEEKAPKPIPILCSTQEVAVTIDITCSQVDAPDNDHQNLGEEYICLRGNAAPSTELADWRISDLYPRYHTYRFGQFELAAGDTVRLHSGHGEDSTTDLYWGYHSAIWNNGGDTVCLYDASGALVQTCDYGRNIQEGVSPEVHCAESR